MDREKFDFDGHYRVKALPKEGTVKLSMVDRAVGRVIQVRLPSIPDSEAELDLAKDSFYAMFKPTPETREVKDLSASRKVNKALMDWALDNKAFQKSRQASVGNLPASISSASFLWSSLMTDASIKAALDKQKEAEEKEEESKKKVGQSAEAAENGDQELAQELMGQAQELQEEADELADVALGKVEAVTNHPIAGQAMTAIAEEAGDEAEKVSGMMKGWGVGEGGQIRNVQDVEDILTLADDDNFSDISEMIGRIQGATTSRFDSAKRNYLGAVTTVDRTKDITKMFPSERIYLSHKAPKIMRAKQVDRWMSDGLLGWKPIATGEESGSFVAMIDGSGSMSGAPIKIAKAVALGIAKASRQDLDNRNYRLYEFATPKSGTPFVTSEQDWRDHAEWARSFLYGGNTDFDHAFRVAMDALLEFHKSGITDADFLFITDMYANFHPSTLVDWAKFKEELDIRLITISITSGGGYGRADNVLPKISDVFLEIDPSECIKSPEMAADAIAKAVADVVINHKLDNLSK